MKRLTYKLTAVVVLAALAFIAAPTPAAALGICASPSCYSLRVHFCDLRYAGLCDDSNPGPSEACVGLALCYELAAEACGCLMY